MVAPAPQASPVHHCQPPSNRIGRWTCPDCGSGWLWRRATGWERWVDADNLHLCAAHVFQEAAERLPWWRWRRRARLLALAADARANAGTTW